MSSSNPTVLTYTVRELIGQGGIASVYRARSPTGLFAAIKIVPVDANSPDAKEKGKKIMREMRIHETLEHPNILKLFGGEYRERDGIWGSGLYIVLDLALGGDLFDKIAPDWGVDPDIAHLYFRQLIDGLRYLGKKGICHRDIKPENCLLDGGGNLKISDFGLATVFKFNGRTRLLSDRCGSPPYAAPELAKVAPYAGEPVDVWSSGILLFALLCGNTPWDEPTQNSPEFADYIAGALVRKDPWNRIDPSAMQLLLVILEVDPAKRVTIKQMESIDWYRQSNPLIGTDGQCTDGALLCSRLVDSLRKHGLLQAPTPAFEEVISASQHPSNSYGGLTASQAIFSQHGLDHSASFQSSLRLYSTLSMAASQRTNPNLTRFFSTSPVPLISTTLDRALRSLGITQLHLKPGSPEQAYVVSISFKTLDKRGQELSGRITVAPSVLPEEGGMEGVEGWDVVLWKRVGEPMELKRLWTGVMRFCAAIVFAT